MSDISTPEGFAAFIAEKLAEDRLYAEARMRGTCTLERPGTTVTDDDGDVTTPLTPVYEGKGYARYPGLAQEQSVDVAGGEIVASRLVYRIPFPASDPSAWSVDPARARPGDVLTIVSDLDNPELAGTVLRVASIDDQSQATAIRLLCVDFQSSVGQL